MEINSFQIAGKKILDSPRFFLVACLVTLLLHAPFLNRPPEARHAWRQSHTLAMARNFYQESMNPLAPRVDNRRMVADGVTGSHFPAYEFGLASIYHLTGEHFWVHRIYSFLLYLLGAFGMYRLAILFFNYRVGARLAFWGYLWSPLLFYHGINALPDILALPASIWGVYFFLKWWKNRENPNTNSSLTRLFMASLLLTTLAGMTKLQYLAIGFCIAGVVLVDLKKIRLATWLSLAFFAVFSLGLSFGWYAYAMHLIKVSQLAEFGLELRPVGDFSAGLSILGNNLVSDLPEFLLNYSGFALLLAGLFYYHRENKQGHPYRWPITLWALGLFAYHLIELSQMKAHQYYMMPYLPLLLLFVGFGGQQLIRHKHLTILTLLLVSQPILATLRIIPSNWMSEKKNVPIELYEADSRHRLAAMVPDDAPCIVGIDESNCIYFYYLNKKGYGISYEDELFVEGSTGMPKLTYYIRSGAQYMYMDDRDVLESPLIQRHVERVIGEEGRFVVVKLKE